MPYPTHSFEQLLARGWTSRRAGGKTGAGSCRVTLELWDGHGNIVSDCSGEGATDEVARQLATNRANAFLFRTQAP